MCVLLVEDEMLIGAIMAESLIEAGYEVMHAATAEAALELVENPVKPFTVLVTDVHLAGEVNGLEVASAIRARWPKLPVIVATARPDMLDWEERQASGYVLLRKPYSPSDLVKTIARSLGAHPPS